MIGLIPQRKRDRCIVRQTAPHFFFYSLLIASYIALFAGFGGFAPAGSLFIWFICGAACLAVMACTGVLIVGIAPNWRFALVVTSGYAAPALPLRDFPCRWIP